MIRLIATDMDGTLLVHGVTGIPDENLRAMKQAVARGIHVALCSGRMPEDMSFFASDAGLNVHILALNGSYCLDVPHGLCVSSPHHATRGCPSPARYVTGVSGIALCDFQRQ